MTWVDQVPAWWRLTPFEDVVGAPIIYGIIQPGDHVPDGVPYIRPVDVVDGRIQVHRLPRTHPDIAARYKRAELIAGDIVLSIVGTIGKVAVVPPELAGANITQTSVRLRSSPALSADWIRYVLQAPTMLKQFDSMKFGLGLQRLNVAHVRECEVPVAPLNEQRRIVEKLDAIFEKSRAAKARLERLPALLDQLKRSILAAAFRGDLTKDWRARNPNVEPASVLLERIRAERRRKWEEALRAKGKDPKKATYEEPAPVDTSELPELPAGWAWTTAGTLIERFEAGRSPQAQGRPAATHESGVLKVSAVSWGRFLPDENKALVVGDTAEPELCLKKNDLLISRANTPQLVGAVVVVHDDFPNLMLSDKTVRLVTGDHVDKQFLLHAFRTAAVRAVFEEDATGTSDSMRNLSQDKIRAAPIALAPGSEQIEVGRRLQSAMVAIDALADSFERHVSRIDAFEQAALAKAFRGELVPQDPADEPADVLLERLRAARASEPAARRTRAARAAPAAAPATTATAPADGDPVEQIIAVLRSNRRQSASAIADATGLAAAEVRGVLKSLERLGKVAVEGKARGTTYVWQGDG